MLLRRTHLRWLAGVYAVALAYLLLAPEPLFFLGKTGADLDAAVTATIFDWIEHGTAYAILTLLFLVASQSGSVVRPAAAALVHGAAAEILQHWIPPREADWIDFAANLCGICLAVLLFLACRAACVDSGRRALPSGEMLGKACSRTGES